MLRQRDVQPLAFPSTVWDFSYWQDLTSGELRAIARRLLPKGGEYRKYFHLSTYSCPHHYLNFDDDYLTAKAADTLVVLPTAVGAALMLYETAVQANPSNARNFAGASLLSVQNGDSVKAAYYLNEGLLIDPENKGLQALLNVWKGRTQMKRIGFIFTVITLFCLSAVSPGDSAIGLSLINFDLINLPCEPGSHSLTYTMYYGVNPFKVKSFNDIECPHHLRGRVGLHQIHRPERKEGGGKPGP